LLIGGLLLVSIIIKIVESLKNSKVGVAFLVVVGFVIATTVMVFGIGKIQYHIFGGTGLVLNSIPYIFYVVLKKSYPVDYDPYISLIMYLFVALIGYISLIQMTEKKGKKRYFHFKGTQLYATLLEMRQAYIFIVLTSGLTYFSLYYYSFPQYFDSESTQIFLWLGIILGIFWILLAVHHYIFISEFLFGYDCLIVLKNKHFSNRLCESLENYGEFNLSGSAGNIDLRDCVERKLIKVLNIDSLANWRPNNKVYIQFIKPFDQICKDREEILLKGLYLDDYFK